MPYPLDIQDVEHDTFDDRTRFFIEVSVPSSQANEFAEQMTGMDDDIVLAAEKAMRALLTQHDDMEAVELSLPSKRSRAEDALRSVGTDWLVGGTGEWVAGCDEVEIPDG